MDSKAIWDILLSLSPILVFMLLLVTGIQTSTKAAAWGLLTAVAVGVFRFSARPGVIGWEAVKGIWNAFTIFTVIISAILIYELLLKAGMFERIRDKVEEVIQDDLLRVLFIGWTFTSFLQSITGFGVPVAVAAPILVSLGVTPILAVVICILGHAWGGTFGTLAIAWDSLFLQVPAAEGYPHIALYTCLMLWAFTLVCGVLICLLYRGKATRPKDLLTVLFISALQGGGQLLFAAQNTSTACLMGSMCSMAGVFLLNRLFYRKERRRPTSGKRGAVFHMIFPFAVLTLLVVLCLFVEPVHQFLGQWTVGPAIPGLDGTCTPYSPVAVFTHSGTLLLVTGLVTLAFYRTKGYLDAASVGTAVSNTLRKAVGAIQPILLLIVMSKVMDGTGQIYILADGIAGLLGSFYPAVAPLVGILGGFISSSNMSSNILFAGFQDHVAQLTHIDAGAILAAQTSGGSVGNLVATSNIVLGLATTGGSGKEGQVMHIMLPAALACGVLLGALTWMFCTLAG